jgi:hypothetical protein
LKQVRKFTQAVLRIFASREILPNLYFRGLSFFKGLWGEKFGKKFPWIFWSFAVARTESNYTIECSARLENARIAEAGTIEREVVSGASRDSAGAAAALRRGSSTR